MVSSEKTGKFFSTFSLYHKFSIVENQTEHAVKVNCHYGTVIKSDSLGNDVKFIWLIIFTLFILKDNSITIKKNKIALLCNSLFHTEVFADSDFLIMFGIMACLHCQFAINSDMKLFKSSATLISTV